MSIPANEQKTSFARLMLFASEDRDINKNEKAVTKWIRPKQNRMDMVDFLYGSIPSALSLEDSCEEKSNQTFSSLVLEKKNEFVEENAMAYEIFAHHAHVFPKNIREDGTVEVLKSTMDECGISKCVCFATFPSQLTEENEETNTWLYKQIRNDPDLYGFGVIDFEKGDLKGQVDRIADFGFKGIKLHPAFQRFAIDGEKAFEVYARAEELGLFLSFHTGIHWHRIKDYQVVKFDEVAYHFPKLRFSMEHLGGYCFFHEGLAVMLNNMRRGAQPRVYAGLTSVFDPDMNRYWNLSDDRIYDLFWQAGNQSSIFGLDFPYNDVKEIKNAIEHFLSLNLPEETKRLVLAGNMKRILGVDEQSK